MSVKLFEVESGIVLDALTQIITGTVVPGLNAQTIGASVGSLYLRTDGTSWKKIEAGSGTTKWALESDSGIFRLDGLSGTFRVDAIETAKTEVGMWMVIAASAADITNKEVVVITAAHNGDSITPATDTIFTVSNKMSFGSGVAGLSYATGLAVDDVDQLLELSITSASPVNLQVTRLTVAPGFAPPPSAHPAGEILFSDFSMGGELATNVGEARWYPPRACVLSEVNAWVSTAPVGASVNFTILKNGIALLTGSIPDGSTGMVPITGLSHSILLTDYLTVNVTQVGVAVKGKNLTVRMAMS